MRVQCCRWLLAAAFACGALGCEGPVVLTDLADELVPEPDEGYERGGRLVAEGNFRALRVEPVPPGFDFALALDQRSDLVVTAISSGDSCRVRDVAAYQPAVWESFEFERAWIPFRRLEDDEAVLRFSDFGCDELSVAIVDGRVVDPIPLPGGGMLVEGAQQMIFDVDLTRETSSLQGQRILPFLHPLALNLLVSPINGELIIYDFARNIIARLGEDVSELVIISDTSSLLWAETDGEVHVANLETGNGIPVRLSDDGCKVFGGSALGGYVSPCEDGIIRLYDPEDERVFQMAADANALRVVNRSLDFAADVEREAMAVTFFRDWDEEARSGTLWAQRFGSEAYALAENALSSWTFAAFDPRDDQHPVAALAVTADDDRLGLVATNGERRVTLLRDVVSLFESEGAILAIAMSDGETGTLVILESQDVPGAILREPEFILSNAINGLEITPEVILSDIVAETIPRARAGGEALFLWRSSRNSNSELFIGRQSLADGSFGEVTRLTERVGPGYTFSLNLEDTALVLALPSAASPSSSVERGPYRLRQLWYERDLSNTIASGVTEFYESAFEGREGILYATSGDAPGLWFSALK